MNPTLILAAAMAVLSLAAPARADHDHDHGVTAGDLTVTGAYARSTNPKAGAAFMTIENKGSSDCVLSAVSAPDLTDRAELHTHREDNGVMSMVPIDSVTVPAGGTHALERGGDHVMLMALETPLKDGDKVALTLDLGACGTLPVEAVVDNKRPASGHKGGHAGGHAGHTMPMPSN